MGCGCISQNKAGLPKNSPKEFLHSFSDGEFVRSLSAEELEDKDRLLEYYHRLNEGQFEVTESFRDLVRRKGIPPRYRWLAWRALSGWTVLYKPGVYERIKQGDPDQRVVEAVEKDLDRTFPRMDEFDDEKKRQLAYVGRSYACLFPQVGYCQGMNFIAGFLLLAAGTSYEDAFYMFVRIMTKYRASLLFCEGLPLLKLMTFQFRALLEHIFPEVSNHFTKENITPELYFTKWILTIFTQPLSFPSAARVWDLIICDGLEMLLLVALGTIKVLKPRLLKESTEGVIELLSLHKDLSPPTGGAIVAASLSLKMPGPDCTASPSNLRSAWAIEFCADAAELERGERELCAVCPEPLEPPAVPEPPPQVLTPPVVTPLPSPRAAPPLACTQAATSLESALSEAQAAQQSMAQSVAPPAAIQAPRPLAPLPVTVPVDAPVEAHSPKIVEPPLSGPPTWTEPPPWSEPQTGQQSVAQFVAPPAARPLAPLPVAASADVHVEAHAPQAAVDFEPSWTDPQNEAVGVAQSVAPPAAIQATRPVVPPLAATLPVTGPLDVPLEEAPLLEPTRPEGQTVQQAAVQSVAPPAAMQASASLEPTWPEAQAGQQAPVQSVAPPAAIQALPVVLPSGTNAEEAELLAMIATMESGGDENLQLAAPDGVLEAHTEDLQIPSPHIDDELSSTMRSDLSSQIAQLSAEAAASMDEERDRPLAPAAMVSHPMRPSGATPRANSSERGRVAEPDATMPEASGPKPVHNSFTQSQVGRPKAPPHPPPRPPNPGWQSTWDLNLEQSARRSVVRAQRPDFVVDGHAGSSPSSAMSPSRGSVSGGQVRDVVAPAITRSSEAWGSPRLAFAEVEVAMSNATPRSREIDKNEKHEDAADSEALLV